MALFKSSNPALSDKVFNITEDGTVDVMTLSGTVNKCILMLLAILATATYSWTSFADSPESAQPFMIAGAIGGFITALIIIFKPKTATYLAIVYALLEGLFLGAISAFMESVMPGIAFQAMTLTFGILASLLFLYKTGIIKATPNFRRMVMAATGGIFLLYLISWIMGMFGMGVPLLHSSGTMGIIISGAIVVIASLNLVLDFDFIERGVEQGAPKYMEWYGAFGLMVTLIWLYLEILRLLSKLNKR